MNVGQIVLCGCLERRLHSAPVDVGGDDVAVFHINQLEAVSAELGEVAFLWGE